VTALGAAEGERFEIALRAADADPLKHGVPVTKARSSLGKDGMAASLNLLLPDAVATGKLTTIPNAIVRQITVDKNTGQADRGNARAVDRREWRRRRAITIATRSPRSAPRV